LFVGGLSVRLYLKLFVGGLSVRLYLKLFVWGLSFRLFVHRGIQHILCWYYCLYHVESIV
jgi:hypothetical protein